MEKVIFVNGVARCPICNCKVFEWEGDIITYCEDCTEQLMFPKDTVLCGHQVSRLTYSDKCKLFDLPF